jgi:antirestriction protein ArdC
MQQEEAPSAARTSVHFTITDAIVAAIEAGAPRYEMPWHRSGPALGRPTNADSKMPYRGVNVLALWVAAQKRGYGSGTWATYRQWKKLEAQVRKGETGTAVVFFKEIE